LHKILQDNLGIVYEMMQYLHKLNEKHISPSPQNDKMNVSIAAETLSHCWYVSCMSSNSLFQILIKWWSSPPWRPRAESFTRYLCCIPLFSCKYRKLV